MKIKKKPERIRLDDAMNNKLDSIRDDEVGLDPFLPKKSEQSAFYEMVNQAEEELNKENDEEKGSKIPVIVGILGIVIIGILVAFLFLR